MSRIAAAATKAFARTQLADLVMHVRRERGCSFVPLSHEARELLASISPKPVDPWPVAHVAERDSDIDLSIIVPVYNEERFVGECLRSICVSKTQSRFEIVVVDDGSTDGSGAVCDEWAARDPRVHIVHQANRGFSGARNAGLDAAKGGGAYVR